MIIVILCIIQIIIIQLWSKQALSVIAIIESIKFLIGFFIIYYLILTR